MTLEDRIFALLNASPSPAPAVGTRFYPVTGGQAATQGSQYPYVVYQEVAAVAEMTHDQQETNASSLRDHHYQFSVFSQAYDEAALIGRQIEQYLVATRQASPGLQAVLPLNRRWGWADADRVYQRIIELTLWEDFVE